MIVVADTGPISYPVQLGLTHLLLERYGKVILPDAVFRELQDDRAPVAVRRWVRTTPPWVEIAFSSPSHLSFPQKLGAGEREAIALALRLGSNILLDDKAANTEARKYGLKPEGTLLVLAEAAQSGSIQLPETLERLMQLGFYMDAKIRGQTTALGRRPLP